ncbi:hypothetical protein BU17DRAFT_85205 [Hysterangium stoloniferum]|nr:hypothetical protein BU17DRAFT_85205 [Hysterangium stoloniferum]
MKGPILTLEDLQILKNFAPELGPQDVLTGGQFFAVMRVVCHAQYGAASSLSATFAANPEPFSPTSGKVANSSHISNTNPFTPPSTSSNSFTRAQSQSQSEPRKPPTEPPPASSNPASASHFKNPRRLPFHPLTVTRSAFSQHHILPLCPFLIRVVANPSITRVPPPLPLLSPFAGCIVCLSPFPYTQIRTHSQPPSPLQSPSSHHQTQPQPQPQSPPLPPPRRRRPESVQVTRSPLQTLQTRIIIMVGAENAAGGRGGIRLTSLMRGWGRIQIRV